MTDNQTPIVCSKWGRCHTTKRRPIEVKPIDDIPRVTYAPGCGPRRSVKASTLRAVLAALSIVFLLGFTIGLVTPPYEDEGVPHQAVMHMSNWTNRTLVIDMYVFAGDTVHHRFTLDHEGNATYVLTWRGDNTTVVLAHFVGPDIDAWQVYDLYAGQWRSELLW